MARERALSELAPSMTASGMPASNPAPQGVANHEVALLETVFGQARRCLVIKGHRIWPMGGHEICRGRRHCLRATPRDVDG